MSGKLDQSLDEIMKDRKPSAGARRGKGRLPPRKAASKSKAATTAVIAPSGGVQKNKASKNTKARVPATAVSQRGDSKISVSGLPEDVSDQLIKDYFGNMVAPVKSVVVNYGPNGRSRGSAVVTFSKPTAAADAAKLDGTRVDGKAMRIEVLIGAKNIPAPAAPKPLHERVAKPKNAAQVKNKAKPSTGKTATNGAGPGGRGKKNSGRAGRPKAKTAEELDAEMQDYFGGNANGTAAVAQPAAVATGQDTGMVDEVM